MDKPKLPPIRGAESLKDPIEDQEQDISVILLSPKKLPKLDNEPKEDIEEREEAVNSSELTSIENLSYSVSQILTN